MGDEFIKIVDNTIQLGFLLKLHLVGSWKKIPPHPTTTYISFWNSPDKIKKIFLTFYIVPFSWQHYKHNIHLNPAYQAMLTHIESPCQKDYILSNPSYRVICPFSHDLPTFQNKHVHLCVTLSLQLYHRDNQNCILQR